MTDHPCYPGVDWNSTIKITVVESDIYEMPFWNIGHGSLLIFKKWLAEQEAQIPAEFLHSADFEIGSVGGYEGDYNATIEINYTRPMTTEEIQENRQRIAEKEAVKEYNLRREYEKLKSRFEP